MEWEEKRQTVTSSEHSNVTSFRELSNPNVADVWLVSPGGVAVNVGTGGTSGCTVNVRDVSLLRPLASVTTARTV